MYLVPIHVPIYTDGPRTLVTTEWHRSLALLRDSLGGRFGPVRVLAPSRPAEGGAGDQPLVAAAGGDDGIELVPSFDLACRARRYWASERGRWVAQVREHVARAEVVHTTLDDVFRPIGYAGYLEAARAGRPTVFVQDTDIVLQDRELAAGRGVARAIRAAAYGAAFERLCRRAVRGADLSLLKGSGLIARYGRHARNARDFHDTSHRSEDVIGAAALDLRARDFAAGRALRLVYCGRLVARKGVDRSLRLVRRARDLGRDVELDLIGQGPERAALEAQAAALGLGGAVRFRGPAAYGPALIRRLSGYDGLLFTPSAEDTPRMIFDGYAAGLPLIASDVAYVRERSAQEGATVLLPRDDAEASARAVADLSTQPGRLACLAAAARRAGVHHAADRWYRRRAEWTIEAVERHRRGLPSPAPGGARRAPRDPFA